jgi:molecular chaperone HtpG
MSTETEQPQGADATQVPFRAEVKQLLSILAHSLYSDREIFLRELLSNASDALHRVQFELLTNREARDQAAELAIRITADEEAKTITIADSGIGMTADELAEHLGTIAKSGVKALMEGLESGQKSQLIGQFGVGFYSAFVVAEEVVVTSLSYRPDAEAAEWRSTGDETFTVGPAERTERGTTITLKLREDAAEFATPWRLRQTIKRHSDFVAFPIYVDGEQANQQTALWRQQPHQVTDEQYKKFYEELTFDYSEPLLHLHVSTDAPIDLHAVLFVPATRERGMLERRIEGKIKLYSRKVLIQEETKDLLPPHFRFVEGVVDSEDLPLNVARETVQGTQVHQRIRRTITGRLTKALGELAKDDAEKYAIFWKEFGPFLKEGIALDPTVRGDLLPLLRFHSTKAEGEALIGLADYVGRMAEGQDAIYYVLAGDLESARQSPHLEALAARDLEALLLTDVFDSVMLEGLQEYEGKPLKNLDDPDLALPGDDAGSESRVDDTAFGTLSARISAILGERIGGVRGSTTLQASPARLVSADAGPGREMARFQRMIGRDYSVPVKTLELNRGHQLVVDLAGRVGTNADDPLVPLLVEQLYDNALLLEGLHPNPAAMVGRLQALMEAAARQGEGDKSAEV